MRARDHNDADCRRVAAFDLLLHLVHRLGEALFTEQSGGEKPVQIAQAFAVAFASDILRDYAVVLLEEACSDQ